MRNDPRLVPRRVGPPLGRAPCGAPRRRHRDRGRSGDGRPRDGRAGCQVRRAPHGGRSDAGGDPSALRRTDDPALRTQRAHPLDGTTPASSSGRPHERTVRPPAGQRRRLGANDRDRSTRRRRTPERADAPSCASCSPPRTVTRLSGGGRAHRRRSGVQRRRGLQGRLAELRRDGGRHAVNPVKALRSMRTPVIERSAARACPGALEIVLSCSCSSSRPNGPVHPRPARRRRHVGTHGAAAPRDRRAPARRCRSPATSSTPRPRLTIGLVNHVVPHDELRPFAAQLAADIAATPAVGEVLSPTPARRGPEPAAALELEADVTSRRAVDLGAFRAAGEATARRPARLSVPDRAAVR